MSTAGKVLVGLILLFTLIWIVLTAGVTQLNRNGNQALINLTKKVEELEEQLNETKLQILRSKDETVGLQEQTDTELAVINARQSDVQRNASSNREILSRIQYELATVQATVQTAEKERKAWIAEKAAETQALEQARAEVEELQAKDEELRQRLTGLRNQFKTTLQANRENTERR